MTFVVKCKTILPVVQSKRRAVQKDVSSVIDYYLPQSFLPIRKRIRGRHFGIPVALHINNA